MRTQLSTVFLVLVFGCSSKDPGNGTGTTTPAGTSGGTNAGTTGGTAGGTPGGTPTGTTTSTPCAVATFEDGLSPTAELFVDPNGDDSTGDGSQTSPFATVERAAQDAVPGTAIRLLPGDHNTGQYIDQLQGTAAAPIWIGGVPGQATPVFDGGSQAMQLSRAQFVVLHDVEVLNSTGNGLNFDDGGDYALDSAHDLLFRDLYVHDIGTGGNQDCLKLSGLRNIAVLNSTFERCGGGGSGSAVDCVGCDGGLLSHNTFRELSGSGFQAKGGSQALTVRHNEFHDAGARGVNMGGSTGYAFFRPPLDPTGTNFEASGIEVVANLFVGGTTPFAFVGCVDCVAWQNTVIEPTGWLMRILQETTSDAQYTFAEAQNGLVKNNLFWFSRAEIGTEVNIGPDTLPDSFFFDGNLFYAWDDPGNSFQGTVPGLASGAQLTGVDPLFVDNHYCIDPTGQAATGAVDAPPGCDRFGTPFVLSPSPVGACQP